MPAVAVEGLEDVVALPGAAVIAAPVLVPSPAAMAVCRPELLGRIAYTVQGT